MRPPEALLPRNPTWESFHFSGLTIKRTVLTKGHCDKSGRFDHFGPVHLLEVPRPLLSHGVSVEVILEGS